MMPAADVVSALSSPGLGFERIQALPGATYVDNSTVIVIPTRGMVNYRVVQAWQNLICPMNGKRAVLFAVGHEVGRAYNEMVQAVLSSELSTWKYVMTLEDDNIPPPDAHIRLLESIEECKVDAVSGIYFTKGDYNMPMAYGNAAEYAKTGVLEFRPIDIRGALESGSVIEVNGIAMGCALWRMDLFREIAAPWFVTLNDIVDGKGTAYTQDLWFCRKARQAAKRFAVDMRVKVGHLDVGTGIVY